MVLLALVAGIGAFSVWVLPAWAAGALLHRSHTALYRERPLSCVDETFQGDGIRLGGWRCAPVAPRRGAIVYLHGIGDNRSGAAGVAERFGPLGFEVIAYDSRAHGQSEGDLCTYGLLEREDLRRVIATIEEGPVVLIGSSLGAAVALETAAIEPRITAVVAAEVFADLRTVATERARRLGLPPWTIVRAVPLAEARAGVPIMSASPEAAARRIVVPVLILHGTDDTDTSPDHSRRVYAALAGPKDLLLVPGVGHNHTLSAPGIWDQVETWVRRSVRSTNGAPPTDGGQGFPCPAVARRA